MVNPRIAVQGHKRRNALAIKLLICTDVVQEKDIRPDTAYRHGIGVNDLYVGYVQLDIRTVCDDDTSLPVMHILLDNYTSRMSVGLQKTLYESGKQQKVFLPVAS